MLALRGLSVCRSKINNKEKANSNHIAEIAL